MDLKKKADIRDGPRHLMHTKNKVRLILMTAPILKSRSRTYLARLRRVGIKVAQVCELSTIGQEWALTPRQTEVLREMTTGLRTKEIAKKLSIDIKTVESHRQMLMQRLGISHIPGLVRYALRNGILPASWLTGN